MRLSQADSDGALKVTFAAIARDPQCERLFDAVGGLLKAAKQRGYVSYPGELLLEGLGRAAPRARALRPVPTGRSDSRARVCHACRYHAPWSTRALLGKHDDVEITVLKPVGAGVGGAAEAKPAPKPKPAPAPAPRPLSSATSSEASDSRSAAPAAAAVLPSGASDSPTGIAIQTVQRIFSGDPTVDWCVMAPSSQSRRRPGWGDGDARMTLSKRYEPKGG